MKILLFLILNFIFNFQRNLNIVKNLLYGKNKFSKRYYFHKLGIIQNNYYIPYLEKIKYLIRNKNKKIMNNFKLMNKSVDDLYLKSMIILG